MQNEPMYHNEVASSAVSINKVLKNTYFLLALTLVFSAIAAGVSMAVGLGRGASLACFIAALVMMFVVHKTANSSKGLIAVFAFTGLLGASLGPMLSSYLSLSNGPSLVMQALGGTGLVFFGLSAYALISRKDFSFMGGFLMIGMIVMLVAIVANIFLSIPVLSVAISAGIVLIMSGFILYDTSRIIHGGETNYILATIGLYLSIYNLFTSMLQLLGVFGGDD